MILIIALRNISTILITNMLTRPIKYCFRHSSKLHYLFTNNCKYTLLKKFPLKRNMANWMFNSSDNNNDVDSIITGFAVGYCIGTLVNSISNNKPIKSPKHNDFPKCDIKTNLFNSHHYSSPVKTNYDYDTIANYVSSNQFDKIRQITNATFNTKNITSLEEYYLEVIINEYIMNTFDQTNKKLRDEIFNGIKKIDYMGYMVVVRNIENNKQQLSAFRITKNNYKYDFSSFIVDYDI